MVGDPGGIVARRGVQVAPRGLARAGLIELGYTPGEAEELLSDLEGDSAEELLAQALRTARKA
jgi:Holliday junction DNA helicase RuvA